MIGLFVSVFVWEDLESPMALTPIPLKVNGPQGKGSTGGDKSSVVKREPLVIKQPTPISGEKVWNVTVNEEPPQAEEVVGRVTRGAQKENRRSRRK